MNDNKDDPMTQEKSAASIGMRGVHHVAMATTDLDAMKRFYCEMFDLSELASGEWADVPEYDALVGLPGSAARFVLLGGANIALELFQYVTPAPGPAETDRPVNRPGITHMAFAVTDIDAHYDRLRRAGVRFHAPPSGDRPIRAAYGRDPEGNVFELLEFRGDTPFDYTPSVAKRPAMTAGDRTMPRLNGKTALVTGASRGIGRAIAIRLAADGALVAVHYGQRRDGAEDTVRQIEAAGGAAFAIGADVRQPDAIKALFVDLDREMAARGHDALDILVNNAGIDGGGGIATVSEAEFDRLFGTNVNGTFLVTQQALPHLREGGRIITISSMVSLAAYPGSIAYAMTKAALNAFTVSLAADLARRGITVNAVCPGATATDFIAPLLADEKAAAFYAWAAALGRLGGVADIAGVVAFLASPDGGWMTGQILQASGGMHL
jgi:3-oxoacyl-[acyl-carrier protein] reductase